MSPMSGIDSVLHDARAPAGGGPAGKWKLECV